MAQITPESAALLLEKWIKFYDMDNPKAWDPDEYAEVKNDCKALQLAVQALRGKAAEMTKLKEAAARLSKFPQEHCMDDREEWEPENYPFVKSALEAVQFATTFLKKQ
jgi:hypothetical protein